MLKEKLSWVLAAGAMLAICQTPAHAVMTAQGYDLDKDNHLITVSPTGDVTKQVNAALSYLILRSDQATKWTLKFNPGQYMMSGHMYADKLQNVDLVSDWANPAKIIKSPTAYANEYMLYCRYGRNITVRGLSFYGKTKVYDVANYATTTGPVWNDQGLYFASGSNITVDHNRFYDIGNGAVRITTADNDPVTGVNSFNASVTNNWFQNIYQVTTTSNTQTHGGTANFLFYNNNLKDLRGSIKFASRTAGATNVKASNNTIFNSSRDGFEISSYVNVELSYNRMLNITNNAINAYTNDRATPGFNWGDGIVIKNNVIDTAARALYFGAAPYSDGFKPTPHNVLISSNTISNISGPSYAIMASGGAFAGLTINNNKLNNITSKKYVFVQPGSTQVAVTGNTVDSAGYTFVASK